MTIFSGFK